MYLYELRNLWQLFFHVTVGAFVTLQIWLRQAQGKAPDHDVWHLPSDVLPVFAFRGQRRRHILTATVMKKPVATHEKLCFLSRPIFPSWFYKLACMPVSMQNMLGKPWEDPAVEYQAYHSRRSPTSPEDLAVNQNLGVEHALRTKQERYNLSLPLWGISVDQWRRCYKGWNVTV